MAFGMKRKNKEVKENPIIEAKKNSIVLIGPVGSGKSLISEALSQRIGLPVIPLDLMRHCPKSTQEIEHRMHDCKKEIQDLGKNRRFFDPMEYEDKMWGYERVLHKLRNQYEMRKLLPNLPNYFEMGYRGDVEDKLRKYGIIAWHFYQKQFENQLLQALADQLNFPCIIDMGGGMVISLDDKYKTVVEEIKKHDPDLIKYFDFSKIGFDQIKDVMGQFSNVICLELPSNYKATMAKAGRDKLNESFIASGQFKELGTPVSVDGLINGEKCNLERRDEIVDEIQHYVNSNAQTQSGLYQDENIER